MNEQGYMKCLDDSPLKPCHLCGAEINANWTIRRLQKEKAKLEAHLDAVKAWRNFYAAILRLELPVALNELDEALKQRNA
jgi:hypothetical protein